ncbi:MFS transporter [Advenella kashmirensis W13003]|uniref:MFS transporter n=1 Tax=Advenella kashmirensis W13003 TaxID=1424334 RepID=V8QMV1_9BURK|nr:tripartite tricarboxylate transporter substrate binding protein [Advenella kashmirensis]ETF00625.1 MFS transporter [Advenella kashmirensis W13003]
MIRFAKLMQTAVLAAMSVITFNAVADEYPSKPVRITVGMAPGGSNDTIARLISSELSEKMGKSFVVENKPGANSTIATSELKRSKPDGYQLMLVISSHVTNTMLYPDLNYKLDDFKPVALIAETPFVLVANPNFKPDTLAQFIALAKSGEQKIDFGTPGLGSTQHIAMELMDQMAGIKMNHVPYKGGAPAQTDLLGGVIPVIFATPTQSLPFIQKKQLKAIAVTSKKRLAQLPEVPTFDEAGLPGYDANVWFGIIAPKDTPDSIVQTLNKEINGIVQSDKIRKRLEDLGLTPIDSTTQVFQTLLDQEQKKWRDVIKKANIQFQ